MNVKHQFLSPEFWNKGKDSGLGVPKGKIFRISWIFQKLFLIFDWNIYSLEFVPAMRAFFWLEKKNKKWTNKQFASGTN